jgi:hypothetical protein
VEVLVVQLTSSIFLYGYFRRSLNFFERSASFVVVILGYTAMVRSEAIYTYLALGLTAALLGWVWLSPEAGPRSSAA